MWIHLLKLCLVLAYFDFIIAFCGAGRLVVLTSLWWYVVVMLTKFSKQRKKEEANVYACSVIWPWNCEPFILIYTRMSLCSIFSYHVMYKSKRQQPNNCILYSWLLLQYKYNTILKPMWIKTVIQNIVFIYLYSNSISFPVNKSNLK